MARRIAWGAWWLGLAARAIQLWQVVHPAPDRVFMALGIGPLTFAAAVLFGTSAAAVGVVMAIRVPGNRFGWIWIVTGLLQAILATLLLAAADHAASGERLALLAGAVASAGVQTAPFVSTGLALLVFPDGRLLGPRWRLVGWGLVAVAGLRVAEILFGTPEIYLLPTVANPLLAGGPAGDLLGRLETAGIGIRLVQLAVVAAAISVVLRYRRSDLEGRRQIRWFLLGTIVLVLTLVPSAYALLVVGTREPAAAGIFALGFLGFALLPLTTLVAISRYRLYAVDRIINRAVLYGSLTALLAGAFTAAVGLAQRAFVVVTGERSDAAIVLTTLVVATAYVPLRKRLEDFVDRRFKYDQARFGAYRDEVSRVLEVVEPVPAGDRLCREAVRELEAVGAAVVDAEGRAIAQAGTWPATVVLRVALAAAGGRSLELQIGPRRDGGPHDAARVAELHALGALVGTAIGPAFRVGEDG